jgi:hypothetical protein
MRDKSLSSSTGQVVRARIKVNTKLGQDPGREMIKGSIRVRGSQAQGKKGRL